MSVKLEKAKTATVAVLGKKATANMQLVADLEISETEQALATYLEVDLTASDVVLIERIHADARIGMQAALRMGLRLMALKDRCEHGEFLSRLADTGVGERDARSCMRLAKVFASEGDNRRRELMLEMGKTKATLLLSAKEEVREAVMSDPDMAQELAEASKQELQHLLKEQEALIARKDKAYADLEAQLEGKSLELRKLSRVDPAALLSRSVRAEALADAAALGECCDNLTRLWEAACDEQNDGERELRQRAVALSISASMLHVQTVYDRVKADLQGIGLDLPLVLGVMDDFTRDERTAAATCLEQLRMQFLIRKEKRAEEAYAEHVSDGGPKKRGRPAKSKTGVSDGH